MTATPARTDAPGPPDGAAAPVAAKPRRTPPTIRSLWQIKPGRITALDGLRGLGITDVVVSHVSTRWTPGGTIFVDLFFVLSGYVITRLLLREWAATGGINLKGFYKARWTRLGPAQVICVALFCIPLAILGGHWLFDLKRAPYAVTYTMDLYRASLPYTPSGNPWAGVFTHTWSLGVEEQFYLVWPLVLILLLRRARPSRQVPYLVGACVLAIIYRFGLASLGHRMVNHIYNSPDARVDQLLAGCALALVVWRAGKPPEWLLRMTRLAIWPAVAGFVFLLVRFKSQTTANVWAQPIVMTYSTLSGVVVICCLALMPQHPFSRFMSWTPFVAIGTLCYGIYVFHFPVVVMLASVHVIDRHVFLHLFLTIVITLVLSALSWRYVETRFHHSQVMRYAPKAGKAGPDQVPTQR
jgi:peptidoglycan/LPS O-acetylase OafA/YrhL